MVGAGIFALLGEASAIASSAVYISFIIGGIIAMLSSYSLGKLGARYPSSGGIIEYLTQAFGVGTFTGSMGVMMYFAAVVSLSLIAKAFGNYAASMIQQNSPVLQHVLAVSIIVLFVVVNLKGARNVVVWERLIVGLKFATLSGLSMAGILYMNPALLSPEKYPPVNDIFFSLAITFFAYEGFRVITNTAEDMPNPERTLPRSMMVSILLVMLLYIAVSFAVFGNLPTDKVIAAKDFALAQAAMPIFGRWGFNVVAIAALISTASSINANLYAVTNVTYQLAKDGELPGEFGKPIAHSREGLIISGILVVLLSVLLDLTQIAVIGSISILSIHAITHVGHLKLADSTKASRLIVVLAAVSCLTAIVLALIYASRTMNNIIAILTAFVATAVITELLLQKIFHRNIHSRIEESPAGKADSERP